MAEIESEKSSTGLAFIVGGLVVAVLLIGYFLLRDNMSDTRDVDVDVTVPAPAVPVEPAPPASGTSTTP